MKSQGLETVLAESAEKTWKQRTEQFMKRTKSESIIPIESLDVRLSREKNKMSNINVERLFDPIDGPFFILI